MLDCFEFYLLTIGELLLPDEHPFDFHQQTEERDQEDECQVF